MDYNRYIGNTGKVYRMPGAEEKCTTEKSSTDRTSTRQQHFHPVPTEKRPQSPLENLRSGLSGLISRTGGLELESEDIMLMLILYLMYRESGDRELLIILGAMLFL